MREGNLISAILSHVVHLFMGFVVIFLMSRNEIRWYKRFSPLFLLGIIILLVVVASLPGEGAKRWVFSRSIQPSDIAKVIMVIYLAKVLCDEFHSVTEFLLRVILPIFVVCIFIVTSHNSNAAIIGATSALLVFMGTSNKKYLTIMILFIFVAVAGYLTFHQYFGRGETGAKRVESWIESTFNPNKDTNKGNNKNYVQAEIAKFALISGGLTGKKPGNSIYRKALSEAHNDFIYAIIVEEYGLIGGVFLIILYLILFYRVLLILRRCDNVFNALILAGLLFVIISQTFIHIGVSSGGLPVTGQNLPLISTGGTSILITSFAFGMILSISRASMLPHKNENKQITNKL
jgi:cell division protein FtsW